MQDSDFCVQLDPCCRRLELRPKTITAHELTLHAWWTDAQVYSDYFFDMTVALKFDALETDLTASYRELDMIRTSFEQADFPASAYYARQHLLNSMSRVMSGFKHFVVGNVEIARQLMDSAERELTHMEGELARLGILNTPAAPLLVH